jgi:hypothetical protein
LSSFTRTIPGYKKVEEVNRVLSQRDHFVPLAYKPGRANPGDFIYLIFQGMIVGRARIISMDAIDPDDPLESGQYPSWARWVVRYAGRWEYPPREIPVQGHQSIRYLETHALEHLDSENWQSF